MILAFIALTSAAVNQAAAGTPTTPNTSTVATVTSIEQRVAESSRLGQLIYAFDRAAWVSSDALMAVASKDQLTGVGGYLVEAPDTRTLRVTYYRGNGAAAQAFFVADVRGGKVVRKELLATPVSLSSDQAVLVRAREVAADSARERSYRSCTPAPFNTVVVPSRNGGPVAVYLLSAQKDVELYPVDGHYRVTVTTDGQVLESRPLSGECFNLPMPKLPNGAKPLGVLVDHLLDPVPTEMHVFASYNLRMPLFVRTAGGRFWEVRKSKIKSVSTE